MKFKAISNKLNLKISLEWRTQVNVHVLNALETNESERKYFKDHQYLYGADRFDEKWLKNFWRDLLRTILLTLMKPELSVVLLWKPCGRLS